MKRGDVLIPVVNKKTNKFNLLVFCNEERFKYYDQFQYLGKAKIDDSEKFVYLLSRYTTEFVRGIFENIVRLNILSNNDGSTFETLTVHDYNVYKEYRYEDGISRYPYDVDDTNPDAEIYSSGISEYCTTIDCMPKDLLQLKYVFLTKDYIESHPFVHEVVHGSSIVVVSENLNSEINPYLLAGYRVVDITYTNDDNATTCALVTLAHSYSDK